MDLDWQKLNNYNQMFQRWKAELFPRQEYAHRNECCFAFAHLLAKKAKEQGMLPLKIWCLKSYDSDHVQAKFPADNANGFETRDWQGYHVALAVDLPIYKNSQSISEYQILDVPDVDISKIGTQQLEGMTIEVIDPIKDYVEMLEGIFDFEALKKLFKSGFLSSIRSISKIT